MSFAKHRWQILVLVGMLLYAVYFSYFTILRYRTLNASYFDLGLMHQTVYNTYQAIRTGDGSRFLELTDPHPTGLPLQVKRMFIHNDLLLAVVALFYFLYSGAETLLIIKSVALAAGAWAVFRIAQIAWRDRANKDFLAAAFALAYLLYPPLHLLNVFDFQAVSLAVPLLLFLFYFVLSGRYGAALAALVPALLAKENVALTVLFFGGYLLVKNFKINKPAARFGFLLAAFSLLWLAASFYLIMPAFRSGPHYALARYQDFGDSPAGIIGGAFMNPGAVAKQISQPGTADYLFQLFGPLVFTPLFAQLELLIALPEFAINLLSREPLMRTLDYHYAAILIPALFFAAIHGLKNIFEKIKIFPAEPKHFKIAGIAIIGLAAAFAYFRSPLPFSRSWNADAFAQYADASAAARRLAADYADERWKLSTTNRLAPLFTGRRYFYQFSQNYRLADYVIVDTREIFAKSALVPVYASLQKDPAFSKIYKEGPLEVYKKKK